VARSLRSGPLEARRTEFSVRVGTFWLMRDEVQQSGTVFPGHGEYDSGLRDRSADFEWSWTLVRIVRQHAPASSRIPASWTPRSPLSVKERYRQYAPVSHPAEPPTIADEPASPRKIGLHRGQGGEFRRTGGRAWQGGASHSPCSVEAPSARPDRDEGCPEEWMAVPPATDHVQLRTTQRLGHAQLVIM
jgi:hypothetical protein